MDVVIVDWCQLIPLRNLRVIILSMRVASGAQYVQCTYQYTMYTVQTSAISYHNVHSTDISYQLPGCVIGQYTHMSP